SIPPKRSREATALSPSQHVEHRVRDDRLLVDGDDEDAYRGAIRRDARLRIRCGSVRGRIELDAEPRERTQDALPNRGGVLADAAAEGDRIDAAEDGCVSPDVLAYAQAERVERKLRVAVPLRLERKELSHVVRHAREPEQARAAI